MKPDKAAVAADQANSRDGLSLSSGQAWGQRIERDGVGFPPGSLVADDATTLCALPIELVTDDFKIFIHRT